MSSNTSLTKLLNSNWEPVRDSLLRSICEAIMTDLMFEIPSQNCESITITKEYAETKLDKLMVQKLRA